MEVTAEARLERHDNELGDVYIIQCPKCGDTIRYIEFLRTDTTCSCGLTWSAWIEAVGRGE